MKYIQIQNVSEDFIMNRQRANGAPMRLFPAKHPMWLVTLLAATLLTSTSVNAGDNRIEQFLIKSIPIITGVTTALLIKSVITIVLTLISLTLPVINAVIFQIFAKWAILIMPLLTRQVVITLAWFYRKAMNTKPVLAKQEDSANSKRMFLSQAVEVISRFHNRGVATEALTLSKKLIRVMHAQSPSKPTEQHRLPQ